MKFNFLVKTTLGNYWCTEVKGEGVILGSPENEMVLGLLPEPRKVSLHCDYAIEEIRVEMPIRIRVKVQ